MNRFTVTIAAAATALSFAGAAFAGDQYVDQTGYAASGYDVVAYFSLPQSAVGKDQPKGVPGKAAYTVKHNGAKFAFSTAENKAAFEANPEKYTPQFDGHCAYGVSVGGKVPGNPNLWRIVDDKLYLNITPAVVGFWEENIPRHIRTAGRNWASLERQSASNRPIPQWTSSAPSK